ncbi:16S rRNA (cytosine(1402)-N(4))-methyltransferase RsmH [Candidatus Babeliales bacterium]|nr:16S rRNA (cytosine(1402)-N(4))-methyltransferase RsmH [Candidatus Babeliales bacterium]
METKTSTPTTHKSVLVQEVIQYLNPQPGKVYVDATFGGGGHSRAILDHEPQCSVIGIDWDEDSITRHAPALEEEYGDRLKILWGNFANLHRLLKKEKIDRVDGILADFGTSQYQIFEKEGFSFRVDTPLDMRMSAAHQRLTAADVVNHFNEQALSKILWELGEERGSRKIAHAIIEARKTNLFKTSGQLAQLIEKVIPFHGPRAIHPATKTFQALRIFVNKELENIKLFLPTAVGCLNAGAPLVCISFHSLEDRLVKTFFREKNHQLTTLTPKPVQASEEEIKQNPSSRSAKLRAATKI